MASLSEPLAPRTSGMVWTGRVLTGLTIAFLLMDAGMKIAALPQVAETAGPLGWPTDAGFWRGMGLLLLACTALYALPRTAVLGAVLLTGYLGGAIATHVRVGSPLFSHVLFGVYVALAMWGGVWLRYPELRAVMPILNRE